MRGVRVFVRLWRSLFVIGAVLVPMYLITDVITQPTAVQQPLIVSISGTHFDRISPSANKQILANATIQAVTPHGADTAIVDVVGVREAEQVQAFTAALPIGPAVAGFFHQLRIVPRIDYSAKDLESVTIETDEYHPTGSVSIRYESWIADGDSVTQPTLTRSMVNQFAKLLHAPEKDLQALVGQPLAIGLLPNYKVRLYAGGALAKYVGAPVYRDIPLGRLPAIAEMYRHDFFKTYPVHIPEDVQTSLDREYAAALKRRVAAPNCTIESCIALTFDDGPDPTITPRVLDILSAHDSKGTFFELGNHVLRSPDLTKRILAAGNEVESHTFSHTDLVKLKTPSLIRRQLDDTQNAFNTVGLHAKFLRPPYGSVDDNVKAIVPMPLILWNIDAQEWRPGTTSASMVASLVGQSRPGAIMLMHDTQKITADALPDVLTQLEDRGFRFVTVEQLLQIDGNARGTFSSRN